jgi:betaine-aldehyde dehydrogenase
MTAASAVQPKDLFRRSRHFIDGRWITPADDGLIQVFSPSTESLIGSAPCGSERDMDAAVAAARRAFDAGPWPRMTPVERAGCLQRMAVYLRERADAAASLITQEMGSPISFTRRGAGAPAALLDYYAGLAVEVGEEEPRRGATGAFRARREPVGVVAAIVPWNGPLFLLLAKCAPALAAGCTVVAKPAAETPLDGFLLADAAEAADLPPGVLNIVPGGREAGEHLVSLAGVDKVTFTGSTAVGRRIAEICGRDLRRVGLELGGKSAAIALDDADPELVASFAVPQGLAFNNGQACAALTRILVPRARQAEFVEALAGRVSALKVGDPLDESTQIGPLVAQRQQQRVESYIDAGKREGGRIAVGGSRPGNLVRGWYVAPTLFFDVANEMRIAREEIFGPVGVVIPYDGDENEAVRVANDSSYGLAGAVFAKETARAYTVAKGIRAGTVGVNDFRIDFMAPFGGYKASGIGRELGKEGLFSYFETKTLSGLEAGSGAN